MTDEYICKQDAAGVIEKEMENYVSDIWYKSATHSALNDVNEDIKSLEPADVAPVVHGRWIEDEGEGYHGIHCSRCNFSIPYGNVRMGYNFCPNCGAKMRGEQE